MVFFNKGERVWASSKDIGWALGTVVTQEGQTVIVKLDSNGDEQKFPEGKLIQFVPESLQDFEDMVKINDLNEPVLLNNLKQRYAADKIYTLIGPVLVSMNPYKSLPIYSRQVMKDYSTTRPGDPKNTRSPHIFSIANNAYRSLLSNRLNQSVVISGESGAGKTEATKFVLQYLAYVSDPLSTGKVEQQILESSPILEAFGNAKTIRNNNSSRFGKFTKITFDQRGHISGAEITNYLLEKSRIPYHAPNERNYHVFYQFCRGASAEERRALDLQPAESYVYLNQGKAVSINGVDDAADYRRLRNAMTHQLL